MIHILKITRAIIVVYALFAFSLKNINAIEWTENQRIGFAVSVALIIFFSNISKGFREHMIETFDEIESQRQEEEEKNQ